MQHRGDAAAEGVVNGRIMCASVASGLAVHRTRGERGSVVGRRVDVRQQPTAGVERRQTSRLDDDGRRDLEQRVDGR